MLVRRLLVPLALGVVLLCAVVVRLQLGPWAGPRDLWPWLQVCYLELGTNIATGRGYWLALAPDALSAQAASPHLLPLDALPHDYTNLYRPIQYFLPAYAYLIAPSLAIVGRADWSAAQTFNALVDGLAGPLVVFAMVSRGGAGHLAGLIAAGLYAASPSIAGVVAQVMPDSLSALLSGLPVACVAIGRWSKARAWMAAAAGAAVAFACAFRGEVLALLPLLAVLVGARFARRWNARLGLASLVVAGWLIGTVPLAVFWTHVYGFPAWSRPGLGIRLWEGIGNFANPWGIQANDEAAGAFLSSHGLTYGTPEGDAFLVKDAVAHFVERPQFLARSVVVRGRDVVRFGFDGWGDWSPLPSVVHQLGLFELLFKVLVLVGAAVSFRTYPFLFALLGCLWLSRVVPFSALEVQPRDLIPLQVVYECWAACGLATLLVAARALSLRRHELRVGVIPGRSSDNGHLLG